MLSARRALRSQTQLRRAAVSVAANIVEGCARSTTREYSSFLNIAFGSAAETRYLLQLSFRLKLLPEADFTSADAAYHELLCALQKLLQVVSRMPSSREPRTPEPTNLPKP